MHGISLTLNPTGGLISWLFRVGSPWLDASASCCDEHHIGDSEEPTLVSPTAVNSVTRHSLFDNFVLGVHPAPQVSFDLFQAVSNETARFFSTKVSHWTLLDSGVSETMYNVLSPP
jgi:hypothetical protein